MGEWHAFVRMVLNLRLPYNVGNSLTELLQHFRKEGCAARFVMLMVAVSGTGASLLVHVLCFATNNILGTWVLFISNSVLSLI